MRDSLLEDALQRLLSSQNETDMRATLTALTAQTRGDERARCTQEVRRIALTMRGKQRHAAVHALHEAADELERRGQP